MPAQLQSGLVTEKRFESTHKPVTFTHKTSRARMAIFIVILVVAASIITAVALRSPQSAATAIRAGSVAPDFTLHTTAGGTFTLSDYKDKSSVLLFFNEGLACSPCLTQMHDLDQLDPQFKSMNLTVASITTDGLSSLQTWASSDGPKDSAVLSDHDMTVSRAWDMMGNSMHPGMVDGHTFVIVNPQGIITWRKDYYPAYSSMYVQNDQLLSDIKQAMGM